MIAKIRRLRFTQVATDCAGYRLGGFAPDATSGMVDSVACRFFGVFPVFFDETLAVSIFVPEDPDPLYDVAYRVNEEGPVRALVHEARLQPSMEESGLLQRAYALTAGAETDDLEYVEGQVYEAASGHKLGGAPFLFRDRTEWADALERISLLGFEHCLQLDTPRMDDPFVDEQWPFPNGIFHLYVRRGHMPIETRWFWEF